MNFNTAISAMMVFINGVYGEKVCWRRLWEPFVLILAPYAPHIAEEMWELLGHEHSLSQEPFPSWDQELATDEETVIVLQVNGKVRSKVQVPSGMADSDLEQLARKDSRIVELLEGKTLIRTIVVTGRLVNFVVRG